MQVQDNLREIELTPGETVQIGESLLTVVEIQGEDITFRIDPARQSETDGQQLMATDASPFQS